MISLTPGEFILRLMVALLLGVVIGLEREYRSDAPPAAGMRSLALVGMGSALFTLISVYGFSAFSGVDNMQVDPSRIAAQIVTGIGFLGAGAILLHRQAVRGLTTAAAIWAIAAIGMAVGLGIYLEAIVATLLALVVLEALRPLEARLYPRHQQSRVRVRLHRTAPENPLEAIQAVYSDLDLSPTRLTLYESPRGALIEMEFTQRQADDLLQLVQRLRALPMVRAIRTEVIAPKGSVQFRSLKFPRRRSRQA